MERESDAANNIIYNYTIPKRSIDNNVNNPDNLTQMSIINDSYYNIPQTAAYNFEQTIQSIVSHINPLKRSHDEQKPKFGSIYKDTLVPDFSDPTLPVELTSQFQPLYCKLCTVQLSSNVVAKLHYNSRNHDKKVRKFLIEYSETTGEPLHKRATLPKTKESQDDYDPKYFHCDICDLPLTGKLHAESHYMGRNHHKALLGKAPAGKGFYDANGKWIRTSNESKKDPTRDNFGLDFIKGQYAVEPVATPVKYTCNICNVNVTSQAQMDMHIAGQKHKKKVNAISLNAELPEKLDDSLNHDEPNVSYSKYRTPSGLYYCKCCNISVNSEAQFKQHLGSKKHIKKSTNQE